MTNLMMRLWKDEEGQGMVEYGLVIVLVSLAALVGLVALGGDLEKLFQDIKSIVETTFS